MTTPLGITNGNSLWSREYNRAATDAHFAARALPLRRHLEIYLRAAENKMRNGLQMATGDMWTRGWEMYKEYSDQIALMDTEVIGRTS
jgi:hypothetical protein